MKKYASEPLIYLTLELDNKSSTGLPSPHLDYSQLWHTVVDGSQIVSAVASVAALCVALRQKEKVIRTGELDPVNVELNIAVSGKTKLIFTSDYSYNANLESRESGQSEYDAVFRNPYEIIPGIPPIRPDSDIIDPIVLQAFKTRINTELENLRKLINDGELTSEQRDKESARISVMICEILTSIKNHNRGVFPEYNTRLNNLWDEFRCGKSYGGN